MTTAQRIEFLEKNGFMAIIKSIESAKEYLPFILDENLDNPFPVFTCRKFDWGTKEYKAMLAFDCHFGAKSPDVNVAKDYLERFFYVANL